MKILSPTISPCLLPVIAQGMSSRRYPSEDDIRMIECAIAQDEQIITSLNSEISKIMAQLEQVRLRKMKHHENIRQYRSLITLARRIPHEILADIFELCVESGWVRAPLVASHVCSAWRKAAAEYPHVWSRIYIDCSLNDQLTKTKLWLSRAQQSPLHITLDIKTSVLLVEDVLSILFQHSTQWRSLAVRTVDSSHLNQILSLLRHPFQQLHRLDCASWDIPTADLLDFSAIQNAPLLHQLNIQQPNLPRWSIPFQLTDLHVVLAKPTLLSSPVLASRWASMLADLLHLKHLNLEVSVDSGYHYEYDTAQVVELPQLESLIFMASPELLGVLDSIRVPMLRKLLLRCFPGQEQVSAGPLIRRFLESPTRIELLELHDVDLPREDLVPCFTLLPRLEELRLHDCDISDDELLVLYGPTGLCPDLARLDVRWCVHLTGTALVQLARSRIQIDTNASQTEPVIRTAKALDEVAAINCLHVKDQDVLDLAGLTTCRLMLRAGDDFCRNRGCCANEKYRQRMRLRHNITFYKGDPTLARIIV